MKYKAHDYQQYATDFIIEHPVSCLILDMGLGKTVITLTALWLLLFDYFEQIPQHLFLLFLLMYN